MNFLRSQVAASAQGFLDARQVLTRKDAIGADARRLTQETSLNHSSDLPGHTAEVSGDGANGEVR
jgi:hypothetical protein